MMRMLGRYPRLCVLALPVLLVLAFDLPRAFALCVAPAMEGKWVNVDPTGVLKKIELHFRCCDQMSCPVGQPCVPVCTPQNDSVRVDSPCATGTCDWGVAVPHYTFVSAADGYQFTRVDARYQFGDERRDLVLLLLGGDQLLVHWSIDYPDGSGTQDFSVIEYFERQRCFTIRNGKELCLEQTPRFLLRDLPERYRRAIRP